MEGVLRLVMIIIMVMERIMQMIMQRMMGIRSRNIIILLILWRGGWIGCLIRSRES